MPIRGATDADGLVGVQVLRLCGACLRWAGVYLFIFRGVLHYKRAGNLVSTEAAGYINRKGEGGKWERGGQKKERFRQTAGMILELPGERDNGTSILR